MEGLSDCTHIVHRASGLCVDVRPARQGQAETGPDAFRRHVDGEFYGRVGLRTKTLPGSGTRGAAGQMWKYDNERLISMGGERDSLVLTAQWVATPGSGLQSEGGRWELILCNAEGSMNKTAHQDWVLCADGLIRLKATGMVLTLDASEEASQELNGQKWPGLTMRNYARDAHASCTWLVGEISGPAPPLRDRFIGCLLGLAVGDSLGSPLEGWSAPEIAILNPTGVRELSARTDLKFRNLMLPPGHLTDRSSMALAVAASVAEKRAVEGEHVAQRSAEFFAVKAINGLGPLFGSTGVCFQNMIQDLPHRSAWPASPFCTFDPIAMAFDGCGGTYRSVAVGLAFNCASEEHLREMVCTSVLTADADYEAAFMTAKAIALLVPMEAATFDVRAFLELLGESMARVVDDPLSLGHKIASNMDTHEGVWHYTDGMPPSTAPATWYVDCIRKILLLLDEVEDSVTENELFLKEEAAGFRHITCTPFPGRAIDTVPIVLWHFALRWRTPRECLVRAAASGGDTASITCVTGALLGTLHGPAWLNKSWFDSLDNGLHGRDFAVRTASHLHQAFARE